jgi:predicted metalloprotease with PDZ domain
MIALALDLTIRQLTDNRHSLDDLMRLLWQRYGKPARGVPEAEIETLASEIAGNDLSAFFANYLYGTVDIPLKELFAPLGIDFCLRPARNADDKGGDSENNGDATTPTVYLGARVMNDSSGARLSHVFDNGPAQKAGLSAGDIIIAIDQIKVNKGNLESMLADYPVDSEVTVHAFRRDELFETTMKLEPAPADTVYFRLQTEVTASQLAARNNWLQLEADKNSFKQVVND